MPDLPPAEGIRSKGFTLKGALAFVEEGYGPAARDRVVEALPAASGDLVRGTLLDGGWYPFRTQVALYEAIDRVLGSGDLALCWTATDDPPRLAYPAARAAGGITWKRTAKKWSVLPASTKRCQMAWL